MKTSDSMQSKVQQQIMQESEENIEWKSSHSQSPSTNSQAQDLGSFHSSQLLSGQFEAHHENLQGMQFYYSGLQKFNQTQLQLQKIIEMSSKELQLEREKQSVDRVEGNIGDQLVIEMQNMEDEKLTDVGRLTIPLQNNCSVGQKEEISNNVIDPINQLQQQQKIGESTQQNEQNQKIVQENTLKQGENIQIESSSFVDGTINQQRKSQQESQKSHVEQHSLEQNVSQLQLQPQTQSQPQPQPQHQSLNPVPGRQASSESSIEQQQQTEESGNLAYQHQFSQQLQHYLKTILYIKYNKSIYNNSQLLPSNKVNLQTAEDQIPDYLKILRQMNSNSNNNINNVDNFKQRKNTENNEEQIKNNRQQSIPQQIVQKCQPMLTQQKQLQTVHNDEGKKQYCDHDNQQQVQSQSHKSQGLNHISTIPNTIQSSTAIDSNNNNTSTPLYPSQSSLLPPISTSSSKLHLSITSQQLYIARMFAISGYSFKSVLDTTHQHHQPLTEQIYQQMLFTINRRTLNKIYQFISPQNKTTNRHQIQPQLQQQQTTPIPILTQTIYNHIKLPLIYNQILTRQSYQWRVYKYFLLKTHIEEKNKKLQNSFVPFQKQLVQNVYLLIISYQNHQQKEGNDIICQQQQKEVLVAELIQEQFQSEKDKQKHMMMNKAVNKEQQPQTNNKKLVNQQPQQQHSNKIHIKSIIHLMDDEEKSQTIISPKSHKSIEFELLKSKLKEYHSIDKQIDLSDKKKQLSLLKEKLEKLKCKKVDNSFVDEKKLITSQNQFTIAQQQSTAVKAKCFVFKSPSVTLQQVHHSFLQQYIIDNGQLLTAYNNIKSAYPQIFTQQASQQGPYSKSSFKNLILKVCEESFQDLTILLSTASKRELQNFALIIKRLDRKNICRKIVIQASSLFKQVKLSLIECTLLKNRFKFLQFSKPTESLLHETLSKCIKCFYKIIQSSNKKDMVKGIRLEEDLLTNLNITLEKFTEGNVNLMLAFNQLQHQTIKPPTKVSSQQSLRQKLIQQIKSKTKYQDNEPKQFAKAVSEFHQRKPDPSNLNLKQNSIIAEKNRKEFDENKKRSYESYVAGRTLSQEQSIRGQSPRVFEEPKKYIKPNIMTGNLNQYAVQSKEKVLLDAGLQRGSTITTDKQSQKGIKEQRDPLRIPFQAKPLFPESLQKINKDSTQCSNIIQESSQSEVEVLQMQNSSKNHKKTNSVSNISSIFKATAPTNLKSQEINKANATTVITQYSNNGDIIFDQRNPQKKVRKSLNDEPKLIESIEIQSSSNKKILDSHESRAISILPPPQAIPPSSIISQRISSLFEDFEKLNRRVSTKDNQIDISDEKSHVVEL